MNDNATRRSGWQTAAALAKLANAIRRIAKAAAAAGLKGAAAAAAKETAPYILKVAVGVIIFLIVTPMLIFAAIPNIFFGYDSSAIADIQDMNTKASALGGVYMSLSDFERTEIDAIVTGLASEYEREGTEIGSIEVDSSFTEDDLLWMIAINSVAYQQDLNIMTAENVRELCQAKLSHNAVDVLLGDEAATLEITFQSLDPEAMMDELGYDEEAKTWVRAIYETLSASDALNTFADKFEAYAPSYSGVTWDGSYDPGGGNYDNTIDMSAFVDPESKNNLDLAAYAVQAWENGWGYVWGTFGGILTPSMFEYKLQQYPDGVGNHEDFIRTHWLGRRTSDCVGLVKGYGWLDAETGEIRYGTNGMPDYDADQLHSAAVSAGMDHGSVAAIPDIPGLVLWMKGHTGVYIGGGYAVEAMGTKYGVVRTKVTGRGWQEWYKLPYITYLDE